MPKFQVSWVKTVVQMCEVEADNADDAIDFVIDREHLITDVVSDPPEYHFHFAMDKNINLECVQTND